MDMEVPRLTGLQLRSWRRRLGFTFRQAADYLRVGQRTVQRWEAARERVLPDRAQRIFALVRQREQERSDRPT
jgi:DNA-binding transcriptional regulator YiaG